MTKNFSTISVPSPFPGFLFFQSYLCKPTSNIVQPTNTPQPTLPADTALTTTSFEKQYKTVDNRLQSWRH